MGKFIDLNTIVLKLPIRLLWIVEAFKLNKLFNLEATSVMFEVS